MRSRRQFAVLPRRSLPRIAAPDVRYDRRYPATVNDPDATRRASQPQKAGGEDLADLSEPFGGAHQVGIEGVGQGRDVVGEVRADVTSAGVSGAEDKCVRRIMATMSDY